MFTIVKRRELNPTVTELCIHAPLIAKKAKAGQFIIVRAKEDSERIPLTIAGFDREAGTVSIIFQVVGAGTMQLNSLKEGEAVHDFVGPLGKATEIEGLKNVCVVGCGVGLLGVNQQLVQIGGVIVVSGSVQKALPRLWRCCDPHGLLLGQLKYILRFRHLDTYLSNSSKLCSCRSTSIS